MYKNYMFTFDSQNPGSALLAAKEGEKLFPVKLLSMEEYQVIKEVVERFINGPIFPPQGDIQFERSNK